MATKTELEQQLLVVQRELALLKANIITGIKEVSKEACDEADEHIEMFLKHVGIEMPLQKVTITITLPYNVDPLRLGVFDCDNGEQQEDDFKMVVS